MCNAQVLDSALLRPGRFDRRVNVERPDRLGREQILAVHIGRRSLPLGDDVQVGTIAAATTGFTGADLANLVNEAALLAGRRSKGALRGQAHHGCEVGCILIIGTAAGAGWQILSMRRRCVRGGAAREHVVSQLRLPAACGVLFGMLSAAPSFCVMF